MKYNALLFSILVFRSWGLDLIPLSDDYFWRIYDTLPYVMCLIAFKVISTRLTTDLERVGMDLMLAVVWAATIDGMMGNFEANLKDLLLIPFVILAVMKNTILKPYLNGHK
jgi:hypothetical protein